MCRLRVEVLDRDDYCLENVGGYGAYFSIRGYVLYVIVLGRACVQDGFRGLFSYLLSRIGILFVRTLTRKGLDSAVSRAVIYDRYGTILGEQVPRIFVSFSVGVRLLQVMGSRQGAYSMEGYMFIVQVVRLSLVW